MEKTQTIQTTINKLNTREKKKERKEKRTKIIICVLIALVIALLSWLNTAQRMEFKDEVIIEEVEEIEEEERYPWKLTEDGDHQEMPEIESNTSHERFKELALDYGLNPSQIWEVENKHWIKEAVILCLIISETSWGHKWYWTSSCNNVWNVYNTDSWKRKCFDTYIEWLEAIWKTLNNKYLYNIWTLWCLSNAWNCKQRDNNWHRYATSESNWEKNMVACLSTVYWERIDPSSFIIRR